MMNFMKTIAWLGLTAFIWSGCQAQDDEQSSRGRWVLIDKISDGDTYWAEGVKYREAKIDTPETSSHPNHGYKCEAERRLGELATSRAEALLLNRKIWVKPIGRLDRYGRVLARARIGRGEWYDEIMIRERLAARWQGRKHQWCAELTY